MAGLLSALTRGFAAFFAGFASTASPSTFAFGSFFGRAGGVFDGLAPMHKAMGIIGVEVFQDPKDPNKVIVIDRYPDMATMERFLANPEFKEAMTPAGVIAPPTVLIGLAT